MLTFPIFIRKNETKIFYIEEPELNIHPSLQRKYLKILSSKKPCVSLNKPIFFIDIQLVIRKKTLSKSDLSYF